MAHRYYEREQLLRRREILRGADVRSGGELVRLIFGKKTCRKGGTN